MDDHTAMTDQVTAVSASRRAPHGLVRIHGHGTARLWSPDGDLLQLVEFENLITQVGDQFYGDRAAGIGAINAVTGMRLGTGTTVASKTGAGSAIVTYVAASQKALDGTYPQSSLSGSSRRITWQASWAAGVATANGISEVVITNESPLTDVAGAAANTIARALLAPTVNKGASDTLTVTWTQDLLGA